MKQATFENEIYTCASCGYCRFGCPVFKEIGFERTSVRGRLQLFKKILEGRVKLEDVRESVIDSLYMCAQCENCNVECPTGINFVHITEALKDHFAQQGLVPANQTAVGDNLVKEGNPYGEPQAERGSWVPKEYREFKKCENLFYISCTASYSLNRIPKSIIKVLESADFEFTILGDSETCCGSPLFRFGERDKAMELVMRNVDEFDKIGAKTIFTTCAGCYRTLNTQYPKDFRMLHITQLLAELIDQGRLVFEKPMEKKIIYYDGCDLGRHSGIYEEPRKILRAIPGVELIELDYNREEAVCCGGPLVSGYPDLSNRIASRTVQEAMDKGADMLVTACAACFLNFKGGAQLIGADIDIQELPLLLPKLIAKKKKKKKDDDARNESNKPKEEG